MGVDLRRKTRKKAYECEMSRKSQERGRRKAEERKKRGKRLAEERHKNGKGDTKERQRDAEQREKRGRT